MFEDMTQRCLFSQKEACDDLVLSLDRVQQDAIGNLLNELTHDQVSSGFPIKATLARLRIILDALRRHEGRTGLIVYDSDDEEADSYFSSHEFVFVDFKTMGHDLTASGVPKAEIVREAWTKVTQAISAD